MNKRQGFITHNPCGSEKDGDAISFKATDKDDILILGNDDVVTLLGKCLETPELIPYISLCLFAGVRPEECKRMKWDYIWDDEREVVHLPKSVTKTSERKTPLHATLRAWLKDCKGRPFKITNHRKTLDRVKEGLNWQKDILRHTAISHFMGSDGNIYQVSEHLGNSPQIIKKHYQRTVLKVDNEFFWSLTPDKVKQLLKEREQKEKVAMLKAA